MPDDPKQPAPATPAARLTDLEPRWYEYEGRRMGFSFLCPCCRKQRIAVDADLWRVTGESFESITVTPSVDASKMGHWHGNITNGGIQ